MIFIVERKQLR